MPTRSLLLVPGPTPVPDAVRRASAAEMVNHRGPEFDRVLAECVTSLHELFRTPDDILAFPASGTGGLEAALVNTLSPGDRVLSCSVGAFGDRFAAIARRFGAEVIDAGFDWGAAVDPARIESVLEANPGVRAVLVTHNETSTGVVNDVQAVSAIARRFGALSLIDSISGLIAHPLPTAEWDLDVVIAGSQKAFMIPPGLAFVSVGRRAWAAYEAAKMPRFYWDFAQMRDKKLTPYTPAVSLFFALQESARMILEEGLDRVCSRHAVLAGALRAGLLALGLDLLAPEGNQSNSVTAVRCPPGVTPQDLRRRLRERYGVVAAVGQGKLEKSIFRVGHLGYFGWSDIVAALAGIEMALLDLGVPIPEGESVPAALRALRLVDAGTSL